MWWFSNFSINLKATTEVNSEAIYDQLCRQITYMRFLQSGALVELNIVNQQRLFWLPIPDQVELCYCCADTFHTNHLPLTHHLGFKSSKAFVCSILFCFLNTYNLVDFICLLGAMTSSFIIGLSVRFYGLAELFMNRSQLHER